MKKKENKMDKKKLIMLISIIPLLIIVLILVNNISYSVNDNKNDSTNTQSIKNEQVVEGLKISDNLIIQDKKLYTYTTNVTNTTTETKKVEQLLFTFYDKENKKIVTLYGYIGREIEPNETVSVSASVDKDITKSEKLEIELMK